jgi:hypothetical protein
MAMVSSRPATEASLMGNVGEQLKRKEAVIHSRGGYLKAILVGYDLQMGRSISSSVFGNTHVF